jgi:RHS repeat-associated protein
MVGICSKALKPKYVENKYKFNDGSELNNSFDIGLYETEHRLYDPQLGRFHQVDLLSDEFEDWSPYTFANDNPVLLNDPFGLNNDTTFQTLPPVVVTPPKTPPIKPSIVDYRVQCYVCNERIHDPKDDLAALPLIYQPPPMWVDPPPGKVIPFDPIPEPEIGPEPFLPRIGPVLLRTLGTIGFVLYSNPAGLGSDLSPSYFWNLNVKPYPGHGNKLENWNPHYVYEFTYKPNKTSKFMSPTLKYGISDFTKQGFTRMTRQLKQLTAKYGKTVKVNILAYGMGRVWASAYETSKVRGHQLKWGYKPIEQIKP